MKKKKGNSLHLENAKFLKDCVPQTFTYQEGEALKLNMGEGVFNHTIVDFSLNEFDRPYQAKTGHLIMSKFNIQQILKTLQTSIQ